MRILANQWPYSVNLSLVIRAIGVILKIGASF